MSDHGGEFGHTLERAQSAGVDGMDEPWINVATYAVVACAPAVAFWGAAEGLTRLSAPRAGRVRADIAGAPAPRPIEKLATDLRRLSTELVGLRSSDLPAKSVRLEGVTLAYDDTLCEACAALGVSLPYLPPLPAAVRRDTELLLAELGLRW